MKKVIMILLLTVPFSVFAQVKTGLKPPELTLEAAYNCNGIIPRLDSLIGNIVVLEFWATWCKYCVASFPEYNELSKKYRDQKVLFIGITNDPTERLEPFLEKTKIDFCIGQDKDGQDFRNYKVWYRPYVYIINRDGIIIHKGNSFTEDNIKEAIATNYINPDKKKLKE